MTFFKKRYSLDIHEAEHIKIQSLLQKENYSQIEFQKLMMNLINENFQRVNNIKRY